MLSDLYKSHEGCEQRHEIAISSVLNLANTGLAMNRLSGVGFEHVGAWELNSSKLVLKLDRMASIENVLYAFVVQGELKYVGKTTQSLKTRLMGYVRPARTQTTNIRNHQNLNQALLAGQTVEIFALPDNGLMCYGQFHLNLAAGLEDSLIVSLRPEWNGQHVAGRNGEGETSVRQPIYTNKTLPLQAKAITPHPYTKPADLFAELSNRVGKTFVTLGQRKPFDLVSVDGSSITVCPASTMTNRSISFKQAQAAFDHLNKNGSIDLAGVRAYSEMNPVYIAALLGDLPAVKVTTAPIVLRLSTVA